MAQMELEEGGIVKFNYTIALRQYLVERDTWHGAAAAETSHTHIKPSTAEAEKEAVGGVSETDTKCK